MHLGTTQLCNLGIKLNTATLTSYSTMILMQYLLFITGNHQKSSFARMQQHQKECIAIILTQ